MLNISYGAFVSDENYATELKRSFRCIKIIASMTPIVIRTVMMNVSQCSILVAINLKIKQILLNALMVIRNRLNI